MHRVDRGLTPGLVVGNMVMPCELEVATCEALVERLD